MKLDSSKVRICNYEPKYAKGIAEMWNNSGEGWNNQVFNYDEEHILKEEANGTSFAVYLALYEDQVIGYVNLKQEAEDIAYLETLTVLPTFHGLKVGKALMQRCVMKTAELGIPGLSLFTSAGNTKAVPLYKKCGFFWQKMDEPCTFLVNFLPYVINNELLKPYFEYFDWYQDLVRDLRLEPDGEERDGHIYYTYLWQKADRSLKVVYDKVSRCISEIENNDFHICLRAANPRPIYGSEQTLSIRYECFNPLYQDISVTGIPEHNILIDYQQQAKCASTLDLEAKYTCSHLRRRFTSWDAHPAVKCKITLNGKSITMGVSQLACAPVKLGLSVQNPVRAHQVRTLYLDLESNLEQDAIINLHFPVHPKLRVVNPDLQIPLISRTLLTKEIDFICEGSCYYTPVVTAEYLVKGSAAQSFELYPELIVNSTKGVDAVRADYQAVMLAGQYEFRLPLREQKNWVYFQGESLIIRPSDFGRPFSDEFETEDAIDICLGTAMDSAWMEVFYESKKHPGLKFSRYFHLDMSGELHYLLRFQNIPEEATQLRLRELVGPDNRCFSFMSEHGLIRKEKNSHRVDFGDIMPSTVTEPWFFVPNDQDGTGITWDRGWDFGFDRWWLRFELDLADLKARNAMESPCIYIYHDRFNSALAFRNFLYGKRMPQLTAHSLMEITANGHNPVCGDHCELMMDYHAKANEKIKLMVPNHSLCQEVVDGERITIPLSDEAINILDARLAFPHLDLQEPKLLLRPKGSSRIVEDDERITISHSVLSIMAKKNNSLPTISSLEVNGMEWLDPIPLGFVPRGFSNPYPGGILTVPYLRKPQAFMHDKHKLSTVTMKDQFDNTWQGLAWESEILNFEPLKGLKFRHQYVSMPGLPILMIVIELLGQECGTMYHTLCVQSHFHPEKVMPGAEYSYKDSMDKWHILRHSPIWHTVRDFTRISRIRSGDNYLHILSPAIRQITHAQSHEMYRCSDYCYSEFPPILNQAFPPLCMIFGKTELEPEMTKDLISLRLTRI